MKKRELLLVGTISLILAVAALPLAGAYGAPLDEIIKGAKKEGALSAKIKSINPKSLGRLRSEIRDRFGVDLDIQASATHGMPKEYVQAAMEHQAGAPPTYDLHTFISTQVVQGMRDGVLERVDWAPLITKDTDPGVIFKHPALRGAIVYFNGHAGLMYNTDKVPASEVPKKLSDLGDPKWKGKVGIFRYSASWARWAFILGEEKTLSDLRAILKNKAITGRYADIYNRFALGEVWFVFIGSAHLKAALDAGIPAAWQSLDFAERQNFSASVRTGARNPNAAKLLAVYLASPAGAKYCWEELKIGNLFYPGNLEHKISEEAARQGIPEHSMGSFPGCIDFHLSKDGPALEKKIKLIIQTGGGL
jgi:iron(III) transport system substrate-binding protein